MQGDRSVIPKTILRKRRTSNMKKLHFDYFMQIDYDVEVTKCNFTIKCIPEDSKRQQIENLAIHLEPNTFYNHGIDGLGNHQIYGLNEEAHRTFFFHLTGDAAVGLSEYEEEEDPDKTMIFRHSHGLNMPGAKILDFYNSIADDGTAFAGRNELEIAEILMHRLFDHFSYQSNSTNVKTSAEEAFSQGHGVCQDYAHIYLSLLHMAKIPARYVTGLLLGEGASHAWVEILCDHKWYGFDPTNNCRVTDNHIRIGVGRDARDCLLNRGIMHGGGTQTQTVHVTVTEYV